MISIKRILIMLAVALSILYVSACILLFAKQRSFLYFPTALSEPRGATVVFVESEGERLRILNRPADSTNAIILFGGNAEDVTDYLDSFAAAVPKENLFLVNYRGYGGSTGTPSEAGLLVDAVAVYDHVHASFPNVSVVGRSLGTGVAIYLASVRRVDKLILITPYDSIGNVAKKHFPIFPVDLLLEDKFDSSSRVKDVTAKTLVLIAENDRTIPRENTDALVRLFPAGQIVVKTLPGTTHTSITLGNEYAELISQFLAASRQ
jgi:pimeloyl-ACP methyl ester carboxylesterase